MYNDIPAIPDDVRATWTPSQRHYYEAFHYVEPCGRGYTTTMRRVGMLTADPAQAAFLVGYYPREARDTLQRFKRNHYDAAPTDGVSSWSTISDRTRHYYPELFDALGTRLLPTGDAALHFPELAGIEARFEALKDKYFERLKVGLEVSRDLPMNPQVRRQRLHEYYRDAFASVYGPLRDLIDEAVGAGEWIYRTRLG